jgi:hypothetical protein
MKIPEKIIIGILLCFSFMRSQTVEFKHVSVQFNPEILATPGDSLISNVTISDTIQFMYSLTFDTLLTEVGTVTIQIGDTTNSSNGYLAEYIIYKDLEGAAFLQDNSGILNEPLAFGYNLSRFTRIRKNINFKWLTLIYSNRSGQLSQKYYLKIEII